jgi:hypothetical protein
VRDADGLAYDCCVIERDDLRTLVPAMRPLVIDFRCEPGEAADLAALIKRDPPRFTHPPAAALMSAPAPA